MTTNDYIHGVKQSGWPRFDRTLWQRNYYEHVIFSLKELGNIRRYIRVNPIMWRHDRDNPEAVAPDRDQVGQILAERFETTEDEVDFILGFDDKYR